MSKLLRCANCEKLIHGKVVRVRGWDYHEGCEPKADARGRSGYVYDSRFHLHSGVCSLLADRMYYGFYREDR